MLYNYDDTILSCAKFTRKGLYNIIIISSYSCRIIVYYTYTKFRHPYIIQQQLQLTTVHFCSDVDMYSGIMLWYFFEVDRKIKRTKYAVNLLNIIILSSCTALRFLLIYERVTFQNFTCVDNPVRIPWLTFWMRLSRTTTVFKAIIYWYSVALIKHTYGWPTKWSTLETPKTSQVEPTL